MAFAQGSRSQLTYIPEVTFGVTPNTPQMKTLRKNTHSLGLTKTTLESEEIRSDRQVAVSRHGNKQVGGSIDFEFAAADFDDVLEGVLFNDFTSAGVLEIGTTLKSYTIEDGQLDINQYRLFTGCAFNSINLRVAPNEMITASVAVVGKSMTINGTSADSTPTAPSTNEPFDSFTAVLEDAGTPIAIASAFEFTLENGINPVFVIGSDVTPQLEYGRARVTGSVSVYFENATMMNKFLNETESDLRITVTDGTNDYEFFFPRVKYNSADVPLQDENSRIITMSFSALYDVTEGNALIITKS